MRRTTSGSGQYQRPQLLHRTQELLCLYLPRATPRLAIMRLTLFTVHCSLERALLRTRQEIDARMKCPLSLALMLCEMRNCVAYVQYVLHTVHTSTSMCSSKAVECAVVYEYVQ